MRILTEASGCLIAGAEIKRIQQSNNTCIATDIVDNVFGKYLADEFYTVPLASDEKYIDKMLSLIGDKNIEMVLPTLDDAIVKWAELRDSKKNNLPVIALSETSTIRQFTDKWLTYEFFIKNDIPTPKTSLSQEYKLIKPRIGRGGKGVEITDKKKDMTGMISQELLVGTEYTVDVFCDCENYPIYIVPRKRINVENGKSLGGHVVYNEEIIGYVKKICKSAKFMGPINIQCFDTEEGVLFTEINPRLGGGTTLGMQATENWIPLIIKTFVNKEKIVDIKPVNYGLNMLRYYDEIYF